MRENKGRKNKKQNKTKKAVRETGLGFMSLVIKMTCCAKNTKYIFVPPETGF